ncbi:hypothetical protein SDRG_14119 [Saprolegnia diclina VS20]|uniref:mRNA m(6)A methyltransferase n=1 Tax=Saprolegnia diclina (strain VS20) TaxID=1156394 RepID=T0REV0_SAPDV|nr:hypothetical protein SDRG_14119 [Saprolegnia diclina VS20]EQC28162.1 hypothetical protein SDRG_14119 [Saprolegnia diclina VS20]|eukprot:XP_008618448.1 hypothetical protein SDRG_14119 [Saprolegnia diclina VS20]
MELADALARRYDDHAPASAPVAEPDVLASVLGLMRAHPELLPIDLASLHRRLALPLAMADLERSLAPAVQSGAVILQVFGHWTFLTHVEPASPAVAVAPRWRGYCPATTRAACRRASAGAACHLVHFVPIITRRTNAALGDCKYLDTCRRVESCAFVHYRVEDDGAPVLAAAPPTTAVAIACDVTTYDVARLGTFDAIVMDPPWEINQQLSYTTLSDDAIGGLAIPALQTTGWIFLWVTTGKLVVGRRLLRQWGYAVVEDIVWIKIDQLQHVAHQGRTGHWLNHSQEHCLVGRKGLAPSAARLDCDVIVAAPRENSRKPDELYRLVERVVPTGRKLEIFGRRHNLRDGWTTMGNQL